MQKAKFQCAKGGAQAVGTAGEKEHLGLNLSLTKVH